MAVYRCLKLRKVYAMAEQLVLDLYGCSPEILNDAKKIQQIAREAVHQIGAEVVEECFHKFEPIGISYIAVITTSHLSIHTWPENGYAAVDIFSCNEKVPETAANAIAAALGAEHSVSHTLIRELKEVKPDEL